MPKNEAPKVKVRKDKIERRGLMADAKKDEMLAILIRNQQAFESVYEVFTVKYVKHINEAYAALWGAVNYLYEKHGGMPSLASIRAELHDRCKTNPDLLDKEERTQLEEFLEYAFDDREHGKEVATSTVHCQAAVEICRELLNEIITVSTQRDLVKDGMIAKEAFAVMQGKIDALNEANSLTGVTIGVPYPVGWDKRKQCQLFTTGVSVLDDMFGGGWKSPEVVLFLGTFGSCKTTTCCHAAARQVDLAARLYNEDMKKWEKTGRKKGKPKPKCPRVFVMFTEGSEDDYRIRIMSNMAEVLWKRLSTMGSMDDLSKSTSAGEEEATNGRPGTKYELKEFKDCLSAKNGFRNEYTRVLEASEIANRHLVLIDCTGSEDSPYNLGRGGMIEIAGALRAYFRRNPDCYPLAFYLDHLSALADRMADNNAEVDEKMYLILKRLPRQAADRITKQFKAPIMLFHQFSGESNKKGATRRFHHAEAAGSRSVGEYVDFAVVAGPVDSASHCKVECTKHRREPPKEFAVVTVQGNFNRIKLAKGWTVSGDNIVRIQDADTYNLDGESVPKKQKKKKKASGGAEAISTDKYM